MKDTEIQTQTHIHRHTNTRPLEHTRPNFVSPKFNKPEEHEHFNL